MGESSSSRCVVMTDEKAALMDAGDISKAGKTNAPRRPDVRQPRHMSRARRIALVVALVVAVLLACTVASIWGTHLSGQVTVLSAAEATATALANPATPDVPVGAVVYQNTFASDAKGWRDNEADCFWRNDGYHVTNGHVCYAPIDSQTDVDITVEVEQLSGPSTSPYGIEFRSDGVGSDYEFSINSAGEWVLYSCRENNCAKLVDYTENDAIHSSLITPNIIEVRVVGSHFEFFVNGTRVGSFDDTSFVAGQVGLVANTNDDCVFTHLVITRA